MKSVRKILARLFRETASTAKAAAREEGLTLIEIMIVVAILGMLAAIIGVNVMSSFNDAKIGTAQTQIKDLESSLKLYYRDCNKYPSTAEGLQALVSKPASCPRWKKEFDADAIPLDPWGNPYEYFSPGTHGHEIEIIAKGKDGELNTQDDVVSWSQDVGGGAATPATAGK